MKIEGNYIDILNRNIYFASIEMDEDGFITSVLPISGFGDCYIFPGFIDSHVHIESSMLSPAEFSKQVIVFGTRAVVSDPHEIANVIGIEGVNFMIQNSINSDVSFFFGAPSCVPATPFETSGAHFDSDTINSLLNRNDIYFLSEVMNFPAVINNDPLFRSIISHSHSLNKPVDGHSPSLPNHIVEPYFKSGIDTCHESNSLEEALFKISLGAKVHIREGSAAKNLHALHSLVDAFPNDVMLCTDDSHPDDLFYGHINSVVKRLIFDYKQDFFNVLKVACVNPISVYHLPLSLIEVGRKSSFFTIPNLLDWDQFEFISSSSKIGDALKFSISSNSLPLLHVNSVEVKRTHNHLRVIKCSDGSLVTDSLSFDISSLPLNANILSSIPDDILKVVVLNKYNSALPAVAFINGFGFQSKGVIASSVAHDSHNYIAIGTDDALIVDALNNLISNNGGLYVSDGDVKLELPLPIAGLMSDKSCSYVGTQYRLMNDFVKTSLGSSLSAPYMTLSFMSLLVIPSLKLSDKGLFDGDSFSFVDLQF